jgi:putative ABC transport system permease protein
MFGCHIRNFSRRFFKRPLFASINVLGLAIGLASCGLIGLYTFKEWQVDRFHEKRERIFRVGSHLQSSKLGDSEISTVGRPVARTIGEEVPGIESVVPLRRYGARIMHEGSYQYEDLMMVGEDFFEVFSFELLEGDPRSALREPYTMVITRSMKQKYFGDAPAIGKTLTLSDTLLFRITGVAADPRPSHIDFDGIISLSTFYARGGDPDQWFTLDEYCYVLLNEGVDPQEVSQKMKPLPMDHAADMFRSYGIELTLFLEPLSRIYLHSDTPGPNGTVGDIDRLYLLAGVALFILLIAMVNFVNLTTARVADRSREIGIRKTLGASRGGLATQFLSESLLYAGLGGILGLFLLELALPLFNNLTGEALALNEWFHPLSLLAFGGFVLLTGLLAGAYPAWLQTRLRPVESLQGAYQERAFGNWLRKGLVIFQFGIAMVLIFSTLVVIRQLNYMQRQDLGFDKEQVMVIDARRIPSNERIENYESIKNDLLSFEGVGSVTSAWSLPGRQGWDGQMVKPQGVPEEETPVMEVVIIDHDYVTTLDLKVVAGRDFSKEIATDAAQGVLLNEAACRVIGWTPEEAIGKTLSTAGMQNGRVIGVLANYHHHGVQREIRPMLHFIAPFGLRYFAMRLNTSDYQEKINQAKEYWAERFPGFPFDYYFLDEDFERQYQEEKRLSKTFGLFGILAVLTSCMGLLGLAVHTTEKRTKEIGIRKVLGASVAQVVSLLNREFLQLVLLAALFGMPIAWLIMNRWLDDFASRTAIPWWLMAATGGLALLIAFLTVSWQSFRAAAANPVDALRNE